MGLHAQQTGKLYQYFEVIIKVWLVILSFLFECLPDHREDGICYAGKTQVGEVNAVDSGFMVVADQLAGFDIIKVLHSFFFQSLIRFPDLFILAPDVFSNTLVPKSILPEYCFYYDDGNIGLMLMQVF